MNPPLTLHRPIIRRLGVMASLPVYRKGDCAESTIQLVVGERNLDFEIRVMGHGESLEAWLRGVTPGLRPAP